MDVKVFQCVGVLVGRNNSDPIAKLLLLQELLSQIFDVTLGKRCLGSDLDSSSSAGDANGISKLSSLAINLDTLLQEGDDSLWFENVVFDRCRKVNIEDQGLGFLFSSLHDYYSKVKGVHKEEIMTLYILGQAFVLVWKVGICDRFVETEVESVHVGEK
eukprot:TRINITY_DN475_c0_g1_i1.p1 TRINITY_DN475_c0_g1~~TRINITY_DN475_c0_g1_i1.p1  ORF type:complete len:159 (+),score=20.56 TRINITY_DN475_c0_g1_i1:79-555(+)